MRLINNFSDFLSALKDKTSEDSVIRNEAKNALGILRQKDPELFDLYCKRKEQDDEQRERDKQLITTFESIWHNEDEVRKQAKEKLCTSKLKYYHYSWDFPYGIKSEDMIAAVDEMPIEDLLTKSGKLTRRDILIKRCSLIVILHGKMDESIVRQKAVKQFEYYCSNGSITVNKPLKKEDVIYYLLNDIPILELLKLFPSQGCIPLPWRMSDFLNSQIIPILPQTHPFILKAQIEANKAIAKAKKKAKLKAKREAKKRALEKQIQESSNSQDNAVIQDN